MEGILTSQLKQALVERYMASTPRLAFLLFSLAVAGTLLWAWLNRDNHYMQAESGAGYALGIIGVSMMVILLLYPLRKHMRFMQGWFRLRSWFRLHMVLGVLGPCCILLHCNFQLGSTNSNVALVAMMLVAGSGLIGRYLYGKFHYGLYGEQVKLSQLRTDLDTFYEQVQGEGVRSDNNQEFQTFYLGCGKIIDSQQHAVSMRQLISQRRWLRTNWKLLSAGAAVDGQFQDQYRALTSLLDKLAGLHLFERLFGLWHIVHIPVFILMIVTAVVHIIAVHWF